MNIFPELKNSEIFAGIADRDIQALTHCLKIKFRNYNKNVIIIEQGQNVEDVILLLKGSANVQNIDDLGDISVIIKLSAGDVYGVENGMLSKENFSDSVVATENCSVLLINIKRLLHQCVNQCPRHDTVLKNILIKMAEKHMQVHNKIKLMSKRNIREKVLAYLRSLSKAAGSPYFDLPFNKTELSNFLGVDRSALSTVLSKLREEGVIDFEKRHFQLKLKN